MNQKLKCIMLFKDDYGLGHLPFFSFLCEKLSQQYDMYILLYSDVAYDTFSWTQIIRIPQNICLGRKNSERQECIHRHLQKIEPDIFLIDYFPFGRFESIFDIGQVSEYVHSRGGKCITFMRDIFYGKSILTEQKYAAFLQKIMKQKYRDVSDFVEREAYYIYRIMGRFRVSDLFYVQLYIHYVFERTLIDGVLVFWDENIFDIRDEFLLDAQEKDKWYHIWYIPKTYQETGISWGNAQKKILVSSGGNITSKADFLALLRFLATKDTFEVEVLVWPYVDEYSSREIDHVLRDKKHMKKSAFKKDFARSLHASDYFFGFGGYGTFQDLFHYQGRAFIMANYNLSNFRHRYYEQKYRAKLFEPILNLEFLDDFSSSHLEQCLQAYTPTLRDISAIKFSSEYELKQAIEEIYNQD